MTTADMSVPTINWGITRRRINTGTRLCILLTFTTLVTLMLLHSTGTTNYIMMDPPQRTDLCTDLKPQTCKLLGLQNNSFCLDPAVKNFACREFCGTCVNPAHLTPAPTAVNKSVNPAHLTPAPTAVNKSVNPAHLTPAPTAVNKSVNPAHLTPAPTAVNKSVNPAHLTPAPTAVNKSVNPAHLTPAPTAVNKSVNPAHLTPAPTAVNKSVNPAHLTPAPTAVDNSDALFKQERQVCNSSFGRTLEDNMAVVSNYPLDGAADYLRKLGVFSTFSPPTRLVPVIATAASANHFRESSLQLENIAHTVIATYPDVEVYFYDMGLTESQQIKIKSFSFVHFRRFPFEDYPPHVSNLKGYTWKPIIIQTVLQEFGFVIWADASVRFTRPNLGKLFSRAEENGIVIRHGHFRLAPHTDIDTFRFLGEPVCPFSEYNEREATFIVVYRTQFINDYVMKPWLSCALLFGCMVTKNSAVLLHRCHTHTIHNECHRFDQSVISMVLTRLFQNLTRFDTPPEVRIGYCRGVEKADATDSNITKYVIEDVCHGLKLQ